MIRLSLRLALAGVIAVSTLTPAYALSGKPATHATSVDWNLTLEQISSTCNAYIANTKQAFYAILNRRSARTFESVVKPLEDLSSDLNDKTTAQQFLFYISTDPKVRQASLDCNNAQGNVFAELTAEPRLYQALVAAQKSNTAKTVYDRKLTALWIDTVRQSGAGLPPAKRAEFVKLSQQLNELQSKFSQALNDDKSTVTFSEAEIKGLPQDFVATLKRNADGTYTILVNESTATPVLSDASDENARHRYSVAYNNRAAGTNVQTLEQAIAVRDRLAHLLGYPNWAAYVLSDRMAKTPDRVNKFLTELDARILPQSKRDIARLQELKAKDTNNPNAVLNPWDVGYYDNMLRKTQYAVDEDAVRQYFPVQHVIDSVLNLYHTLLGINFTQVKPAQAWNPDVLEYKVTDTKTGALLGTTFFDLYPREGKYSHFANFPILPVRVVNGQYRAPIAVILGNWPQPAPGHPALLSHDDVVTFFHEFGHNLAALLTTAPYETLSSGFVRDFVEAPSQMLENFMWQPSILKQVSSNWQTGQPLPDDLIAKMVRARFVNESYFSTRQIMLATIDMEYHTNGPTVDTTSVWERTAQAVSPMPMTSGTHPQASFGHLMGGYDAGYYGYLWSKVYAQDMFTAFQKGGLENPVVGMRYRTTILQPSRTYDPDVLVRAFLGRDMNPEAFYREFDTSQK
ncbi:MAG: Zn-dependent oligopeptidase [Candidatus Eremiobacteraeota bacterium]|nr:Zn-dependent oligopeptidase [Candidatus Eremiobacteraeota bacterium]